MRPWTGLKRAYAHSRPDARGFPNRINSGRLVGLIRRNSTVWTGKAPLLAGLWGASARLSRLDLIRQMSIVSREI